MARHQVRVSVVERNTLFAESMVIALTLEGHTVCRVQTPETSEHHLDVEAMLATVLATRPEVVLMDLDLNEPGDGALMVDPLTRAGVPVVVVTGSHDHSRWGEALAHGARRVMPKSSPLNDIAATIRKVHQGHGVTSADERTELLRAWHAEQSAVHEAREKLARLTPREEEVLAHFVEGRQVKEIASRRGVSEATVRTQAKAILAKLEVSSQLAAVGVARQAHWVPPAP